MYRNLILSSLVSGLRNAGDKTIGFVSSFDQRKSWYHPQIKVRVGERAAKWALTTRYGLLAGRAYTHRPFRAPNGPAALVQAPS